MSTQRNKGKSHIKPNIIALLSLLIIYLCLALYFKNHFYFRTTINGVKASGKTVEQVDKEIESEVKNYTLQLEGRDKTKENISSKDINLKYKSSNEIKKLKKSENPFNLFKGVFIKKQYEIPRTISYDEKLLKQRVDGMAFFNKDKITDPKNASLKYEDKDYKIVAEVMGNKVIKDILYKEIKKAIVNDTKVIDLDKNNCYENPKYTSKSKEVIKAKKTMHKYVQSVITYDIRGNKEVLDGSIINTLIKVDDKFNVSIDEEKVGAYIDNLSYHYNTIGITRNFVTALGQHIKVSGGSYGWSINRSKEVQDLVQAIKDGKSINKKPAYSQTTPYNGADEIGNSYVEIDLKSQHLWVFKNGAVVTEGNVVTGNVSQSHGTPEGVYKLEYKEKNAVLKGENYAAPVNFWMPFNGGIGMHDASWRKDFGGIIYESNGSHGCVNCPYDLAQAVFENTEAGTPVVCHN